jgi:hypothetical protein
MKMELLNKHVSALALSAKVPVDWCSPSGPTETAETVRERGTANGGSSSGHPHHVAAPDPGTDTGGPGQFLPVPVFRNRSVLLLLKHIFCPDVNEFI